MRWLAILQLRLRSLLLRGRAERELDEELQYHLERSMEEERARGTTAEEARYRALRSLRDLEQRKEECRDMRQVSMMENLVQDFRYAVRGLKKNPGFAAVAILTLALGVGATTAVFSVVEAVLLRALPYPEPERILRVWEQAPNGHRINLAYENLADLRRENRTLSALAGYGDLVTAITGAGEPARLRAAVVTRDFFRVMGRGPQMGRAFAEEELRPHGAAAAVVSYGYWREHLGSSQDLSRFRLKLLNGVYPVVGVMPEEFNFPRGTAVWIPAELDPDAGTRTAHNWKGVGRLREGITKSQAQANLGALARRIKSEYGKQADLEDVALATLADATVGSLRTAILTVAGAVGLLLCIACANVAGVLLARNSARRKELAVRVTLGAGLRRLVQLFLAEACLLAAAGGMIGVLLAVGAIHAVSAVLPADFPRQGEIALNTTVLCFGFAITVAVAVSLGFFSAWRAGRDEVREALNTATRTHTSGFAANRFRGFLVAGEIALTLVILAGAGLLGRSFLRLASTTPGFRQDHLITLEFSIPASPGLRDSEAGISAQVRQLSEVAARLRSIPGVQSVGIAGALPVAAGDNLANGTFLLLHGQKAPADFAEWGRLAQERSQTGHALYAVASQGYFQTLNIPVRRGRLFGDQDGPGAPHVAVISEALARERWPNQNPLGQRIHFGNMDGDLRPMIIVGVVGDVRAQGLDAPPSSIIYVDYRQRGIHRNASPAFLVRSDLPLAEIAGVARMIFHDVMPDAPVRFSTFTQEMGGWLAERRFLLLLMGAFALAALSLSALGIYGVVAFSVARRTQEIGIRMALGALRGDVLRLVVGQGARLALVGVALGLIASVGVMRLLSSLLFGVTATDPMTFAGVAGLLTVVALLASYLPARRAMRLDPNDALRYE